MKIYISVLLVALLLLSLVSCNEKNANLEISSKEINDVFSEVFESEEELESPEDISYSEAISYEVSSVASSNVKSSKTASNISETSNSSKLPEPSTKSDNPMDYVTYSKGSSALVIDKSMVLPLRGGTQNLFVVEKYGCFPKDYTPPNYMNSDNPKHPINYAVDIGKYYSYLLKIATKENIEPDSGHHAVIQDIQDKYGIMALIALYDFGYYDRQAFFVYHKKNLISYTKEEKNKYIRETIYYGRDLQYSLAIQEYGLRSFTGQEKADLIAKMEAEMIPMIENFIKNGASKSAIASMQSKYGDAFGDWQTPQAEIDGKKPKRYQRREEGGTIYYDLFFDPADVYIMNDDQYYSMLNSHFSEIIRKEMATIPVEINIDSLKAEYDAFSKK